MKEVQSYQDMSNILAKQAIQDERNQIFDQKLIQIEIDTDKLVNQSSKLLENTKKLNQDIKDLISSNKITK